MVNDQNENENDNKRTIQHNAQYFPTGNFKN